PTASGGRTRFVYTGELANTPKGGAPFVLDRSYTITAEVEIPPGGAEGMLVTDGGRFGGFGFYLLQGKPVFVYNYVNLERIRWEGKDALTPGKHTLVVGEVVHEGVLARGQHALTIPPAALLGDVGLCAHRLALEDDDAGGD